MSQGVQQSASNPVMQNRCVPVEWRMVALIIMLSSLVVAGLFWHTIRTLVEVWSHSRTFAHGFLVLPAALYLIWCYRDRVVILAPAPSRWGLLVLVLLGGGWLIGSLTNAVLVQQVAVIAMFPGLVWTALGSAVLRALLFPLAFLFFALPLGTSVEPWLQDFTAAFIVTGLQLVGVPVQWEGHLISIPSRTWEVARDCGGLRYVLPGLALAYLGAAVLYRHWLRRLGLLLLCAILLVLANGIRAYGIILGDHLGIAIGTDHRLFSYAIYGMAMMSLLWLGLKWKEPGHRDGGGEQACASGLTHSGRETALAAARAVALLALAPLAAWLSGGLR